MTFGSYTWQDAVSVCYQQGAHLATITSYAQNRWVYEYFRTEGLMGGSQWIGLNDISTDGKYQWVDGNASYYRNWFTNQPNNNGGSQNCVIMWQGYLGQWGAINCGNAYPAVCEWNATVTPNSECKNYVLCMLLPCFILHLTILQMFTYDFVVTVLKSDFNPHDMP